MKNKLRAALLSTGILIVGLLVNTSIMLGLTAIANISVNAAVICTIVFAVVSGIALWIKLYKDML